MKRAEPLKTSEDLGGIGLQALKHWRRYRPKLTAALEAEGTLYDHLAEAEERTLELHQQLFRAGMDSNQAMNQAMSEYVLLPDSE